jgi:hypothetical protein
VLDKFLKTATDSRRPVNSRARARTDKDHSPRRTAPAPPISSQTSAPGFSSLCGFSNVHRRRAEPTQLTRIGRDDTNECRLDFLSVSCTHCVLDLKDGCLVLRDEASGQGTWVRLPRLGDRDQRLLPGTYFRLDQAGGWFRVGPVRLRGEVVLD